MMFLPHPVESLWKDSFGMNNDALYTEFFFKMPVVSGNNKIAWRNLHYLQLNSRPW
jgi:hypothetical protein